MDAECERPTKGVVDDDGPRTALPTSPRKLTIQIPLEKRLELAAASGGGDDDGTRPPRPHFRNYPDGGITGRGGLAVDIPQGGKLVAGGAPINITVTACRSGQPGTPIAQEVERIAFRQAFGASQSGGSGGDWHG